MLEAMDIVLICLGTVVLLLALLAFFLLLIIRRRKPQQKPISPRGTVTREYYLDQHPVITASLKNGAVQSVPTVATPSADLCVKVNGIEEEEVIQKNEQPEASDEVNLTVEKVSEIIEVRRKEEVQHPRGVNSIKRQNRPSKIKLSPDVAIAAQAEAVQTEHTVDSFPSELCRIRQGNDSVLHEEFQILETWDSAREKNCTAAEKRRTRNRFVDILPNDDTRVILRGPDDYINASLIDGYNNSGQFIATQGPVGPEEIADGRKESTQRCTQYWPLLGEMRKFGEVEVDLISESVDPVCIHRELDIRKDGENRQVSQYHFLKWRDARGPESTDHLLDFVERVMLKQYRKPIVVHCSAGVGRTGVLIALWRLIERARKERLIDIFGTVDALRRQRSRMVQTPEQYLSLYEAISLAITQNRL